jgi:GR25 family glycosyltransferase involved in LPS biosynthesis
MVQENLPMMFILEDDLDLRYSVLHEQRLRKALTELKESGVDWDLLYVGSRGWKKNNVSPSIAVSRGCNGLYGYLLTQKCAKLLLARARPISLPIDVFAEKLADVGYIKAFIIDPALCYVTDVVSDTAKIA